MIVLVAKMILCEQFHSNDRNCAASFFSGMVLRFSAVVPLAREYLDNRRER